MPNMKTAFPNAVYGNIVLPNFESRVHRISSILMIWSDSCLKLDTFTDVDRVFTKKHFKGKKVDKTYEPNNKT